ncbi:MAG: PilZ domain-containing protein [Candidatus Omnitrophota bacterium]
MQEQRRFPRLDVRVKVEYQVLDSTQDKIKSFTKNVSQGGICLFLNSFLDKGTLLDLKLFMPDKKEPILATGKIAWVEKFEVGDSKEEIEGGIEFINISDEDRRRIAKYIFGVSKV